MAPEDRPDATAEFERYSTHQNDPGDRGYRQFLGRVVDALADDLPPGAEGLDYGSGPGPTLSTMIEKHGFAMSIYDPFFKPDPRALDRAYDFITCTEVAEHFFRPRVEFERLNRLLRPGGRLAVMTGLFADQAFEDWWYVKDETHVVFYRPRTMEWIGEWMDWTASFPGRDVVVFRKGERL